MGTIREERELRNLSHADVASKAEISTSTVIRAENGMLVLRRTARAIARVFGMQPEQLTDLNYVGKRKVVAHVHTETGG